MPMSLYTVHQPAISAVLRRKFCTAWSPQISSGCEKCINWPVDKSSFANDLLVELRMLELTEAYRDRVYYLLNPGWYVTPSSDRMVLLKIRVTFNALHLFAFWLVRRIHVLFICVYVALQRLRMTICIDWGASFYSFASYARSALNQK